MITLKRKTIFIFTTSSSSSHLPSLLKRAVSHFSSSSGYDFPSSIPSSSALSSEERRNLWRNHDEERKTVKVSVWWDLKNCEVPNGVNVAKVAQRITSALRTNGIKGPVTITAFGDVVQLSRANQEALSATGISLYHVPCGKNNADRSLLVDLVYWVSHNPPPAHLLLISGDRDFANGLHRLRMSNYNVLLACNDTASDVLCSAASIMWCWNSLVRGEKLTGRHFNQPPDGTYSWYGHYKGLLEDPFLDTEKPSCSKLENCADPKSDIDPHTPPETLTEKICQIVDSYANGVEISLLGNELKSQVSVDKDFFKHMKFSNLLMSMPDLLKLRKKDGKIIVHSVWPKAATLVHRDSNSRKGLETSKNERYQNGTADLSGSEGDTTADASEKLNLQLVDPRKEEPPSTTAEEIGSGAALASSKSCKEGVKLCHSKENISNPAEKSSTTFDVREMITPKVDSLESRSPHLDPLDTESSGDDDKKSGLFGKIVNWFKILIHGPQADQSHNKSGEDDNERKGKTENHETLSTNTDNARGKSGIVPSNIQAENHETLARNTGHVKPGKDVTPKNIQAECHELFSTNSFWDEIKIFLRSPKGASLVNKSMTMTRLQIAEELQKKGPAVLKNLSGAALIHLTHLLISEKRWLKHYSSQTSSSPSNVIHPRLPTNHATNGLRAILSSKSVSQGSLPSLSVLGAKEHSDHTERGVNYDKSVKQNLKPYQKNADQMLKDCQKLVAVTLEKYPEGFVISSIPDLFREKYGYSLKYQMLGHSKLASLIQTIHGVRIEGTLIVPSEKLPRDFSVEKICDADNNIGNNSNNKDVNLSDSVGNGDNDSSWEELGPICNTKSDGNVAINRDYNRKTKLEMSGSGIYKRDYDLSDVDFSDSDSELTRKDLQEKLQKGRNYEDNTLIQTLDSWYTSKEGNNVGHSRNDSRIMDSDIETGLGQTTKARKSFTFVEDKVENDKGKLIHSILGSLWKSDMK